MNLLGTQLLSDTHRNTHSAGGRALNKGDPGQVPQERPKQGCSLQTVPILQRLPSRTTHFLSLHHLQSRVTISPRKKCDWDVLPRQSCSVWPGPHTVHWPSGFSFFSILIPVSVRALGVSSIYSALNPGYLGDLLPRLSWTTLYKVCCEKSPVKALVNAISNELFGTNSSGKALGRSQKCRGLVYSWV